MKCVNFIDTKISYIYFHIYAFNIELSAIYADGFYVSPEFELFFV